MYPSRRLGADDRGGGGGDPGGGRALNRAGTGARAELSGRQAEALAEAALAASGWLVLARRVRTAAGEIDLVAEHEGVLAFIEVKARPSLAEAAVALGRKQRERLLRAGECWLAEHPGRGAAGVRFDLLLVAADGTVRRIADAFRLE